MDGRAKPRRMRGIIRPYLNCFKLMARMCHLQHERAIYKWRSARSLAGEQTRSFGRVLRKCAKTCTETIVSLTLLTLCNTVENIRVQERRKR
jgi:hypothetical protein